MTTLAVLTASETVGLLCGSETINSSYSFSSGAPLVADDSAVDSAALKKSNEELIAALRYDAKEEALHEVTMADAELGRMTRPVRASSVDLSRVRLVPRYVVCCCSRACCAIWV